MLLDYGSRIRAEGIDSHAQYERAAGWVQRARAVGFRGPEDPLRRMMVAILFSMHLWKVWHPEEKYYCMECGREYTPDEGAGQIVACFSGDAIYEDLAELNCPGCFRAFWRRQQELLYTDPLRRSEDLRRRLPNV